MIAPASPGTNATDLIETPAAAPVATPIPEGASPFSDQVDSLKRNFHSAKFRMKDGKPQLDSQGRFCPLGSGRKQAGTGPAAAESRLPGDDPAALEELQPIPADMTVDVAIGLVQAALIMIGQEEGILTEPEKVMLRGPLLRIIRKHNIGDKMSPELEFAAAFAVVILARLKQPKTQGWFQSKFSFVVKWWRNRHIIGQIKTAAPDPFPTA